MGASHSPAWEEDLGLANIALDLIGLQRGCCSSYAGEIEGRGRDVKTNSPICAGSWRLFQRDPGRNNRMEILAKPFVRQVLIRRISA